MIIDQHNTTLTSWVHRTIVQYKSPQGLLLLFAYTLADYSDILIYGILSGKARQRRNVNRVRIGTGSTYPTARTHTMTTGNVLSESGHTALCTTRYNHAVQSMARHDEDS